MDERSDFFNPRIYGHGWVLPVVSSILYVVSAVYVGFHPQKIICANTMHASSIQHQPLSVICILFWAAAPPLFFSLEYFWISHRKSGNLPSVEAFKYSQDLASKVWLVAVAILVFLYAGKVPGS